MRRRDLSLTLALCVSLGAHAAITYALAAKYVAANLRIWSPPIERSYAIEVTGDDVPNPSRMFALGASDGTGKALNPSPGDDLMTAPEGFQEQAFLSHDPVGNGQPQQSSSGAQDESVEASRAIPYGVPPTSESGPKPPGSPQPAAGSEESSAAVATQAPGAPGDPAPMADTDSDPFSVTGGIDFRSGRTEARFGRNFKAVRPRIDLATNVDLAYSRSVTVVLHLEVNREGKVVRVDVKKSSGSANLDQACKVAAFKWWFEPRPGIEREEFDLPIRFL